MKTISDSLVKKNVPWKALSMIVIIAGYALNLVDVSIGNYAKIYNVIVTFCYIVFWIVYLLFNRHQKDRLTLSAVISGITFISSILITIVNFTDYTIAYWDTIYLLTAFSTPFYGVRFIVHNMVWCMVAITAITGIWFGVSIILRKRSRMIEK